MSNSDRLDEAHRVLADEVGTDVPTLKSELQSLETTATLSETAPEAERTTDPDMEHDSAHADIMDVLDEYRLSDLWDVEFLKREVERVDDEQTRNVLQALLDYNEEQKGQRAVVHSPRAEEMDDEPVEGASKSALAKNALEAGAAAVDVLAGNGSSAAGGTAPTVTDPSIDYQDVQQKLEKADAFDRRGMDGHADTLRQEAADTVGAEDHTEIDLDVLAERAEQAKFKANSDEPDLDTLSKSERVDEAALRAKKAKSFEARGGDDRAKDLWSEAEEFLKGIPAEELEAAGYDTLAALVDEPDYQAQAAEYEDWDALKSRIDTLEKKIPAMESRVPSRARELKAELDALEDRAEEFAQ